MEETQVITPGAFELLDCQELQKIDGGAFWIDFFGTYILGKVLDWAFKPIQCY